MRIANNVAFGTISYILSGSQEISIKYRRMGYWKEEIFDGKLSELRSKKELNVQLETMKVSAICTEGDVLLIGIEKN